MESLMFLTSLNSSLSARWRAISWSRKNSEVIILIIQTFWSKFDIFQVSARFRMSSKELSAFWSKSMSKSLYFCKVDSWLIYSSMKISRCSRKIRTKKVVSILTTTWVRLAPNQYIVREIGTNPQASWRLYRDYHKNQKIL